MQQKARRDRAPIERRIELKATLLTVAARTTKAKTLTALSKAVNRTPEIVSNWIREGEVPPRVASELLKLPGANPEGAPKIELKHLTPSVF